MSNSMWGTARLGIMMLALVIILALQAKEFDETELKVILSMFFMGVGAEGGTALIRSVFQHRKEAKQQSSDTETVTLETETKE